MVSDAGSIPTASTKNRQISTRSLSVFFALLQVIIEINYFYNILVNRNLSSSFELRIIYILYERGIIVGTTLLSAYG